MKHTLTPCFCWLVIGILAWHGSVSVAAEQLSPDRKPAKKLRIEAFPNTPVWTDAEQAAKEFPGFAFMGEYVRDEQALRAPSRITMPKHCTD